MREFKFRLFNTSEKKMYNDVLIGNCKGEATCPLIRTSDNWVHINESTAIIMQYTGFKDKNNVEIFEGDTIAVYDFKYEIFYVEEDGSWGCRRFDNDKEYYLFQFNMREVEVIGSKYE